jgi:threonine dehydrogenase-like Zn-dependent dehydrogenase
MKAIAVTPGKQNSIHLREVPMPVMGPDQVLVRTLRVGLCGTDGEINHGDYGTPPKGDDYLILGHENFGMVEEVAPEVHGFKPGDFVVATVRRPCYACYNCDRGENDMCTSGDYTERGIKGRHGFMSDFYVEAPHYLIKVPPHLEGVGVLLEPMSVVEKGIDHAMLTQRRLQWNPKTAVVLGAGPVGMLAAAILRIRGLRVVVVGREPETDTRGQLAKAIEAEYFSVAGISLLDLPKHLGPIDLAIEATGSSTVVFNSMQILAPNGLLCLLSVTGGFKMEQQPVDVINQKLVLGNNVVLGSVNANPRHFRMGVDDFGIIDQRYPGFLGKLITHRLMMKDFMKWFTERGVGIKTTLEIGSAQAAAM